MEEDSVKREVLVEIGPEDSVVIDKMYGPMVFTNLRIRPDLERNEWVIERQTILPCHDPEDPDDTFQCVRWVVWTRIPGWCDWEDSDFITR